LVGNLKGHLSKPKYRPDIDGLRAVAIISVVIYHFFPHWMMGGFIGVDIFFVISGYLISLLIFENIHKGTFSFSSFYIQRINRIFPSLILVLMSCYVFGWFTLYADEYRQLGKHIAAGSGFVSNIIFQGEKGYFDNSADTKPLLHLWSLGVEEQFYIFWPLLLWIAWKYRFNILLISLSLGAYSFYVNLDQSEKDIVTTFYSTQVRLWELLAGSVLASIYHKNNISHLNKCGAHKRVLSNISAVFGALLLICGLWAIGGSSKFPGIFAAIPVLGTVLIIAAGRKAWINNFILSSRPLIWFGLISFPLYLWHWPLLAFVKIILSGEPGLYVRLVLIAVSILLAWLTYKFIECPVRANNKNTSMAILLVLLMIATGYVGFITYAKDGFILRKPIATADYIGDIGHLDYHKYMAEHYYVCEPPDIAARALRWEGVIRCLQSKPNSEPDFAIMGDSHAEHLFYGVADSLPHRNVVFYINDTLPFLDMPNFKYIYDYVIPNKKIKDVILAAHWTGRAHQVPSGTTLGIQLLKAIDALTKSGKRVYLTDNVPSFPFPAVACKRKRWFSDNRTLCEMNIEIMASQTNAYIGVLKEIVEKRPNVKLLGVGAYFCDDSVCKMTKGDKILFRDHYHLNIEGSLFIGRKLVEDNKGYFDR
jgi:peptidoglycan/LPS O-acetylase OafA/YrhL